MGYDDVLGVKCPGGKCPGTCPGGGGYVLELFTMSTSGGTPTRFYSYNSF